MKNLLTSLRASNETYNSMKHSARAIIRRAEIPLLAVIVLYKAATNLLFVPLMQQLWSLTLRFAPVHYLNNSNASDIFVSPVIILCLVVIALLTAFWALYEFSVLLHGLELARSGRPSSTPPSSFLISSRSFRKPLPCSAQPSPSILKRFARLVTGLFMVATNSPAPLSLPPR